MIKKCYSCGENIKAFDTIIEVNELFFHNNCVTLYPVKYVVFCGEDFIGDSENYEGDLAFSYLDKSEYEEEI